MSKIKIQGNASGTGVLTIEAPNTNTDRTISLPDSTDTLAGQTQVNRLGGRKNLIINGGFDVSQRGDYTTATTASGGTYYLDRFKTVLGGAFTYTHKISQLVDGKYVNTLLQTMTATGYSATHQFVEDFAKFKGQTLTLSMWVKSNKAGANIGIYDGVSQTNSSSHTGGGNWEKLTVSHTCSTSTTVLRTEVWTSTGSVVGSYIEFANLQLELGDQATDFEHRSYGEELALCQRYFYPIITSASAVQAIGQGVYWTSTVCHVNVQLPTTMRDIPTLTATSGVTFTSYYGGTATNITFSSQGVASTNTHLELVFSGVPQGNVFIRGRYNTSFIFADAEL